MKNRHFLYMGIVISMIIFWTCKTQKEEATFEKINGTTHNSGFVANPQDIEEHEVKPLPINAKAPDFQLPGVDGKFYKLKDFDDVQALIIIFTCNHCPTTQAYEDRIIQLVEDYKDEDVRFIAISPNSVKTVLLEELGYSDLGDSYEEMKIRATDKRFNFPYLYDGDTQEASIKYGPIFTPQAYVFDRERKLKYTGRLDSYEKPGSANADDLRSAIDAVLLGVEILEPVTKTFGCAVKWGWEKDWNEKINEDWAKMPVTLKEINEEGVKILMKNDSDNLWLINVWATWSEASRTEFSEFVKIYRMYIGRDFEFISLCADKMDQKEKALTFLENKDAAMQNYIFLGTDLHKLCSAIDPEWDGAMPYTILIEPDGNVVYKKMGIIDPLELKKAIVDHPMIGRYY